MSLTALALQVLDLSLVGLFPLLIVIVLLAFWRWLPRQLVPWLWLFAGLRLLAPLHIQSAASRVPAGLVDLVQRVYAAPPAPPGPAAEPGVRFAYDLAMLLVDNAALLSRIWLAGFAAMLLYGVGSYLLLLRRMRCATPAEYGVYECDACASPFILGFLRPRVILPYGVEVPERELILHHERRHIRQLDHLKKPLAWFILSLHWFNPLVWIAFSGFCYDMEVACDDFCIQDLSPNERKTYAETLLRFSSQMTPLASPVAFGEVEIKDRIHRVLSYGEPEIYLVVLGFCCIAYLAAALLTNPPA